MNDIINQINKDESIALIKPFIKNIECYLVGGYIRDLLHGEISYDKDLIVKSDVCKNLAIEIADKTNSHFVTLDEENKIYRVVMQDKKNYFDISAMLDDDFEKDINRRDLSINSIVYDLKNEKIIDKNNGITDFKNKILKTANLNNFIDDPLRMLRVFRFVAKYNFEIDSQILDFIKNNLILINNPAKERINTEIMKLFEGKYSSNALKIMDSVGLLDFIFPVMKEVKKIPPNTHHHLCLQNHLFETVNQIQKNYESLSDDQKEDLKSIELGGYSRLAFLKFAGFMHDIGKPDTWTIEEDTGRHRFITHDEVGSKKVVPIMKDLKFSKKQIAYVEKMIKFHIYPSALIRETLVSEKATTKFYRKMYPYCSDIILLSMSDRLSAMGKCVTVEMIIKNISYLNILWDKCIEFNSKEANPKPFLTGNEIMNLTGLPQSKELGIIIKDLYNQQLEGNVNSKEEAIEYVKKKQ